MVRASILLREDDPDSRHLRDRVQEARAALARASKRLEGIADWPDRTDDGAGGGTAPDMVLSVNEQRQFRALKGLLAVDAADVEMALTQAAQQIAEALQADKVDVFVYQPSSAELVAMGTSVTPMGALQHELGLHRLPVADGGSAVEILQTGRALLMRDTHRDAGELRPIVEQLGVRSQLGVPLTVQGERRGVLLVCSATPACFSEDDLGFVVAAANWVGLVGYRPRPESRTWTRSPVQKGSTSARLSA